MCPENMTSQLEEEEDFVDGGAVLLDDDSPGFRAVSPPVYQRRSPPQRSVSESELTRVRPPQSLQASLALFSRLSQTKTIRVCFGGLELFWFFGHNFVSRKSLF